LDNARCNQIGAVEGQNFETAQNPRNRLREKGNFASEINVNRQSGPNLKKSLSEKRNLCYSESSRALQEGRFAIVTSVGCGMRWT